jgi:hypothetical protein
MTAPPATENVVRVFVSSTFRDMHAERDHLVTVVFPELRERLEPLGLELRDVDLRWGIPQTGVDGERANPWAYCKQWIERSEPLFVSILGQRYGCKPEPADIAEEQDRRTFAGMSITEMEVRHAVLTGRLRRRSFFYFRKPKVPPAARPEVYREFVDAADEPRLDALRQEIALRSGRPVRWYDCRWSGSGFESLDAFGQAVLEDLWSGVLRDDRYVPREAWRRVLGRDPDRDPIYTDESKPVPRPVWERVVAEARPKPRDPLDAEAEQMAAFSRSLLRWFQGRHSELAALARFVEDQAPAARRVCVVKAVPGQGKSALLARFWQDARQPRSGGPPLVLAHFVGATQQSADPRLLLERLLKELDRNGIAPAQKKQEQEEPGDDLDTLAVRLAARLEKHAGEPRVVLLLDGLNQLTWGHGLSWLPRTFGPGVRVIATCIDAQSDGPERQVLAALMDRGPMVLDLRPLDAAAIDQVVREFLREHCKELEPKPLETICAMPQSGNPLYLLVMLNELRTLGGNDMNLMVPKLIAQMRQSHPDTVALFDWLLQRLEVFGPDAVRHWCSCLAAGRTGMASPELRDLLARKLGPAAGSAALRIERGLRRYLQRRGPQLDFFHGQLRQAVLRRYLAHDADRISTHQDVANYLESRWREPHRHALEELPHQRRMARDWQGLDRVLSDLAFVEAKSCAGMVNELAQDYAAAGADLPEGQGGQVPAFADFFAHARALLSEMLALAPPERASPVRQLAANWKEGSPVRTAARNLPAAAPLDQHRAASALGRGRAVARPGRVRRPLAPGRARRARPDRDRRRPGRLPPRLRPRHPLPPASPPRPRPAGQRSRHQRGRPDRDLRGRPSADAALRLRPHHVHVEL